MLCVFACVQTSGEAQLLKAMAEECSGPVTGLETITTFNYGCITTTMAVEWAFVVAPDSLQNYPGSANNNGHRVGRPVLNASTGEQLKDGDGTLIFYPARKPVKLQTFLNHSLAQHAKLSKPEVIALRLFTGERDVYLHVFALCLGMGL